MRLDLPDPVMEYLASDSAIYRTQLRRDHPELDQQLGSSETRQAMLRWLGSEDRTPDEPDLIATVLGHMRADAQESEAETIRPLTLHAAPVVRLRAFEFLLTLYFPTANRPALIALLQTMLVDDADEVRAAAARYVERADAAGDLASYLRQWLGAAEARGWVGTESHRQVGRLTGGEE